MAQLRRSRGAVAAQIGAVAAQFRRSFGAVLAQIRRRFGAVAARKKITLFQKFFVENFFKNFLKNLDPKKIFFDQKKNIFPQKIAGFLPSGVFRSSVMNAFDIDLFHFFDFFSNQLQLQSTQTAIWTRIRATIRARVRIRTRIRARAIVTAEKCARVAASLGAIGHGHREGFSSRGSLFFEAIFGMVSFVKMVANGTSDGLTNVTKSDKKQHLKRSPQNMLNIWTCKKRVFE